MCEYNGLLSVAGVIPKQGFFFLYENDKDLKMGSPIEPGNLVLYRVYKYPKNSMDDDCIG